MKERNKINKGIFLPFFLFAFFCLFKSSFLYANSMDEENSFLESQNVESIYDDFSQEEEKKPEVQLEFEEKSYKKISDLIYLAPFKEVAVIQKRFFPKANRFELSANGIFNTRNALFQNFGGALRANYYISQVFGFGGSYYYLFNHPNSIIKRFESKKLGIGRPIRPKQYIGGNIHWNPVYGKMAFLKNNIIPFDMHFSLYLGASLPEDRPMSLSGGLGVGQTFPLSKSLLFRWDFNWNVYRPRKSNSALVQNIQTKTPFHNDLFFSMGLSVFIPKAKYR